MSQQWKNSETGGDDDVQVPLGTGEGAAPEEMYVEKKPRMNSSTLTLFAAFAAALVALYLLGLQNKPRHANAEKIKAQEATSIRIDELSQQWGESASGLQGDIQRLVSILTKYLGTRQEESLDIGGNPFEREVAQSPFVGTTTAAPIIPANTKDATELREVAEIFNSLKLQERHHRADSGGDGEQRQGDGHDFDRRQNRQAGRDVDPGRPRADEVQGKCFRAEIPRPEHGQLMRD